MKVDFFLGTREEFVEQQKCIAYSICWELVDVRVDLITVIERISDLDFHYTTQQMFIDDHVLSGEVVSFYCERADNGLLTAFCKILLGRDY